MKRQSAQKPSEIKNIRIPIRIKKSFCRGNLNADAVTVITESGFYKHRKWCGYVVGTVDAHKCTSLIYTDFEIRSAFVRMYNTLKQNVKIIIDETLAQLNALKVKVNAGNNEIAEIDGEIASLAEQNKVYSELYASGVIDEVTYLGRSDKYKNQIIQ